MDLLLEKSENPDLTVEEFCSHLEEMEHPFDDQAGVSNMLLNSLMSATIRLEELASISFDRQVYVIQKGPMEFVVELGFLAPMKAGIGALAGIEEMKADAFSAAGAFAQSVREINIKTSKSSDTVLCCAP
mgnify:CR=1 FL=1